MELKQSKK